LKNNRKLWLLWLQSIGGLIIVAGFGYYLWVNRSEFLALLDLSYLEIGLLVSLIFVNWILNSYQGYVLNKAAGINIGFWENFVLMRAAMFGNYLPARPGTIIRAHYLKSIHGLRYARFGSIFLVTTVLTVIVAGFCGLVAAIWLALSGANLSTELIAIFAVLLFAPGITYLMVKSSSNQEKSKVWVIGRLQDMLEGFRQLRAKPGLGLTIIIFLLLQYVVLSGRFYVAAKITGSTLPLPMFVLMAPLAALMTYISFTPGALGLREAIMGFATYAAGMTFAQGIFIGTVDRVVLLVMDAAVGGLAFIWVWRELNKKTQTD
jgi:uncharacterized protein (TIRG00374 family)